MQQSCVFNTVIATCHLIHGEDTPAFLVAIALYPKLSPSVAKETYHDCTAKTKKNRKSPENEIKMCPQANMSCSYRSGYGYPVYECQEPTWPGNEFYIEGFHKTRASCDTFKRPANCGRAGMPCCYSNVMSIQCDNPLKSRTNTWCTDSFPKGYFMSPEDKKKFQWGW